ncbi:MAG TPA: transposase [Gammaproteobacteria bacterium]|nr:transposase [Gammaproteobacteria bacterium]
MARKPRIHQPEACYHVILRGNAGQDIFFTNEDRHQFYNLIHEGILRFNYRVHAFCLMNNHVHILLQVSDVSISKIMQNICFRYAQWVNKRQKRIGHLFQGRFKTKVVDSDEYLLQLIQYIHLNPVKAKLVLCAKEYPWSSYLAYLDREFLPWLTTDFILNYFGSNRLTAIENFCQFMEKKNDLSSKSNPYSTDPATFEQALLIEKYHPQQMVIVKNFLDKDKDNVIKFVCDYYNVDETHLHEMTRTHKHAKIRAIITWLIAELNLGTMTSIARYFKRDVTGVIRTLRRLKREAGMTDELYDVKHRFIKSTSQA